jgi:Uma2 family endonuclease
LARISYLICNWLDQQPQPHGEALLRAPLIRLRRNPDTTIAPDVAHIPAELARRLPEDAYLIDEVPSLVVEVVSQLDDIPELSEKVIDCLGTGVKLVWVADARVSAITAYRADADPIVLHRDDTLIGESALPGFQVPMRVVFG